jgi:hypothetical protein
MPSVAIPTKILNDRTKREALWSRFLEKIEVTDECWWWEGSHSKRTGYGAFWYEDENVGAHVMACHLFFGTPIHRPRSEAIDHLCRNKLCVRPSHLDPTTMATNVNRAPWSQVTECPHGHQYTVENTYMYRGIRHCRRCHAEREAKARAEGRRPYH